MRTGWVQEEKAKLLKELATLETQAGELEERAEKRLSEKELLNVILREKRRDQQLSFAAAQSAVSAFMVFYLLALLATLLNR